MPGAGSGGVTDGDTGTAPAVERFDPTAQFKAAYRAGTVREEGTVTVGGRRAYRLVVEHGPVSVSEPEMVLRSERMIMLFDAQTLEPIEEVNRIVIEIDGRRGIVQHRIRYTTFQVLPRTAENLSKLKMLKRP
jgi:hypothetical protein